MKSIEGDGYNCYKKIKGIVNNMKYPKSHRNGMYKLLNITIKIHVTLLKIQGEMEIIKENH